MKSKKQNNVAVSPIVFTPELMKLPGGKQVFKQLNALNELKNLDNKLKPVVDAASIAFGEKFETFAQVVKYVAKKTGEKAIVGRRGFTDEQELKIIAMNKDGKAAREIAEEFKCKPSKVSSFLFNWKKKNK
jgi:DNA-binding NarL/FixJ family response regulator